MNPHRFNRLAHKWISVAVAFPLLVIFVSGILLLLKKDIAWVQPRELRGSAPGEPPRITMPALLDAGRGAPGSGITSWADIARVDMRPDKGLVKLITRDAIEVQLDAADARVLQVAKRRSDWIASIHDGTILGGRAKHLVALPCALILLALWFTGLWLFITPYVVRYRRHYSAPPPATRSEIEESLTDKKIQKR